MIGLGQIPFSDMGLECSGVVTAIGHTVHDIAVGDRVCGLTRGGYSNFVRVNQSMVAKIPETLGFTAAATIPVVFCTAYYALIEVARLVPGESLLIHSAAGGVGQAAIMVAQHIGDVEIFATVGSHEKKTFLIENYAIMEDHIFSSRETFFGDGIRNQTNGKGVDVILNSLAGEALSLSWRQCLAPLGRFVEIGKRDLALNNNLEMEKFSESATFAGVDLGVFASLKPVAFKALLNTVLELHRVGALVAVSPITVFGMSDISKAMRLMQSGKHMGKVVINAGTSNIVQVSMDDMFDLSADTTLAGDAKSRPKGCSTLRSYIPDYWWYWRCRTLDSAVACVARCQVHSPSVKEWPRSRSCSRTG